MEERLQKIISASGMMSRRAAEEMISAGKVSVNGVKATLGQKADPSVDNILVNGRPVMGQKSHLYVMLNKPAGYVTTASDEQGRETVLSLLTGIPERVYPVGRLDMYSSGLLLLTNDGELANAPMHPSHEIEKTYELRISGEVTEKAAASMRKPILIDDRMTNPAVVEVKAFAKGETTVSVTIKEGRNRQIRRLCERAGLRIISLKRMAEGPLALGKLETGKWRYLTEDEVRRLKSTAGL